VKWRPGRRGTDPRAFLSLWRVTALDGFEWDVPAAPENAARSGTPDGGTRTGGYPAGSRMAVGTDGIGDIDVLWHGAMSALFGRFRASSMQGFLRRSLGEPRQFGDRRAVSLSALAAARQGRQHSHHPETTAPIYAADRG
jgi:hypothetical protein